MILRKVCQLLISNTNVLQLAVGDSLAILEVLDDEKERLDLGFVDVDSNLTLRLAKFKVRFGVLG